MHKRSLYLSPEWYVLSTYEVRTKYLVLIPGYVYFYLCIENRFFFSGKCELSHVDGSLPPQQNWEPLGSCLKRPPNAVTLPKIKTRKIGLYLPPDRFECSAARVSFCAFLLLLHFLLEEQH